MIEDDRLASVGCIGAGRNAPMRVVILTGDGPRFILPFLRTDLSIVGIIEMNKQAQSPASLREHLKELIRRMRVLKYCRLSMQFRAKQKGCSRYLIDRHSTEELTRCLKKLKPDVVVAYKVPILNPNILTLPRLGFINLHPSLLPRYRGGHPILWMARDYDLGGGVSVHFMVPQADRGELLAQATFPITPGASEEEVEAKAIHQLGIPLAVEVLRKLERGVLTTVAQPVESPTPYAYRRSHQQIWKMIDWDSWSLEHAWHMLRCQPFWKSRLPNMQGWRRWVEWRIGSIEAQWLPGARGEIESRRGGYRLRHRHGWISIVPVIRPKRLLKLSLLWLLERPVVLIGQYGQRR
jgi:folate-dependent phosphoribosylglycinamide formyltransferase PurN